MIGTQLEVPSQRGREFLQVNEIRADVRERVVDLVSHTRRHDADALELLTLL